MRISLPSPLRFRPGLSAWLRRVVGMFFLVVFLITVSIGFTLPSVKASPSQQFPLPTNIVISEFRTRGPIDASDEFIEIYNPTSNPIDIGGWKIWGSNNEAPVPGTSVRYLFPASPFYLQPGQYYLVKHSSSTLSSDGSYGTAIADNGGIALTLADNTLVDQVGMGANSAYKELPILTPMTVSDSNKSYQRKSQGLAGACQDTNSNSEDFQLLLNPSPRKSTDSYTVPCQAPTPTPEWQRRVLINEVAWGGTQADDILAQWIELYNPSLIETIDLTGWTLRIPGKGAIPLSGSIVPGGYYLIERNQSDTSVLPSLVYAFPFLDVNGDSLYLYSETNNLVDTANSNGGPWPAGNRFGSYASMERRSNEDDTDSAWLTFFGTGPATVSRAGSD